MPPREWRLRIADIVAAAGAIGAYTRGLTFEQFAGTPMAIDAVVRNFQIVGEAARNVPGEITARHPGIPWDDIVGMRNVVVHEYFGVDLTILWSTIQSDLPPLVEQLRALLDEPG